MWIKTVESGQINLVCFPSGIDTLDIPGLYRYGPGLGILDMMCNSIRILFQDVIIGTYFFNIIPEKFQIQYEFTSILEQSLRTHDLSWKLWIFRK